MRPDTLFLLAFGISAALPLVMPNLKSMAACGLVIGGALAAAWMWQARAVESPGHRESLGDPAVVLLILICAGGLLAGLSGRLLVAGVQHQFHRRRNPDRSSAGRESNSA